MNEFIPDYKILSEVRISLVSALQSSITGLEHFPAVKWKLLNIHKMNLEKHRSAVNKLKQILLV